MSQIDAYLKRICQECSYDFLEDLYALYSFISNNDLRIVFASYHTQLNNCFSTINEDIQKEYDSQGNPVYKGGYYHAQDSRDCLTIIDEIEYLRATLKGTCFSFKLCDYYEKIINNCKQFVMKVRGSTIPEGFSPIDIIELKPIFQIQNSISIEHKQQEIRQNLKLIGEGSYAKVFSYRDPYYDTSVALKRAHSDLNKKEIERFKQEFDVLKSLNSPYIIQVYAYNEKSNEYTMERMDETIFRFIERMNTKLSLKFRKRLISQVCRGFSYIHGKGILHRDISLNNVFVKHYEDVDVIKIADFGLVKLPQSNLTSQLSEIKGSLNDSDLVNVGFANYDMFHETYALTRLCYYILTGRTNISKQKNGSIKEFWMKGTSTNRNERFKSVEEVFQAVQQITDENK